MPEFDTERDIYKATVATKEFFDSLLAQGLDPVDVAGALSAGAVTIYRDTLGWPPCDIAFLLSSLAESQRQKGN